MMAMQATPDVDERVDIHEQVAGSSPVTHPK